MQLPKSNADIDQLFVNEDFVIQTCLQMAKDLTGLVSQPPAFDLDLDENALEQITAILTPVLLKMSAQNLQQFIYKVDIKEEEFLHAMALEDDCHQLAHVVIKREAQKVYLRAQFQ